MISKTVEPVVNPPTGDNNSDKVSKEVLLIAQQIQIARSLASNDLRQRTKQLKKLKKWFNLRANSSFPFSDDDFLRVWKGLFYCMWMSDKPLVQESLAEDFGSLLPCFSNPEISAQFFGTFLKTMSLEWFGIDQWRIDKFLMLIRRMLRHMFGVLRDAKWKKKGLLAFTRQLSATVLAEHDAIGLTMHVTDIYLEELAKVADGSISTEAVALLMKPFMRFMATLDDRKLLGHVRRNIFYQLMWQSDLGREFQEKFNAWKEMGFPTENINDLEKVEEGEEDEIDGEEEMEEDEAQEGQDSGEKSLDPRAGCVDVVIPELPVDVAPLIKEFEKIQFNDITNTKSRKVIREILEKCKIYQTGEFPLGVRRMPRVQLEPLGSIMEEKVDALEKLDEELHSTTRALKKLNKKKRKRILQSIDLNSDGVNEDNFEKLLAKAIPSSKKPKQNHNKNNDGWEEADASDDEKQQVNGEKKGKKKNKKQQKQNEESVDASPKQMKSKKDKLKLKKRSEKLQNGFTSQTAEDQAIEDNITKKQKKQKLKAAKLNGSLSSDDGTVSPKKKVLKISADDDDTPTKTTGKKQKEKSPSKQKKSPAGWEEPLEDGEIEYFIPSRKLQVKKANQSLQEHSLENTLINSNLVPNPFAKKKASKEAVKSQLMGKGLKKAQSLKNLKKSTSTPLTSSAKKRVKIALNRNIAQKASEYVKQVLSSPQVPYDAEKKPTKSLLKPNLMPSPINPFYKKKIGLKLLNDTM